MESYKGVVGLDKRKKGMISEKNLAFKKILVVFSVLAGIAIVVLWSAYINMKEIETQTIQNLEDVARQNSAILESKVQSQYKLLLSLSKELEGATEDDIEDRLKEFQIFLDEFHLKRFAICFPGGMAYSTDGEPTDLSYREFYQEGMKGKCYITGIMSDALQEEHSPVNVMTIPVYAEDGTISGVFGLTYETEKFNESLQIKSFEGQGFSCIINEEGEILSSVGNEELQLSHNIFEDVLKTDARNEEMITNLQNLMKEKKEGSGTMYLSEKQYYYVLPVDLMDGSFTWYILTIVPDEVLSQRISPIQENQYFTVLIVALLSLCGALLIIAYIREQHRQISRIAYEDSVTKGANYARFHVQMEQKRSHEGSLVVMDIANFNNISVVAGETAGDKMIKETWKIIIAMLRKDELAAHVRDDMFLLFLQEKDGGRLLGRIQQISEKICEKAKEFAVYGIHARYGMYRMEEKESLESAYSKAMLAKEYAVETLGQSYAFYSEVDRVKVQHEKQLEDSFPSAIEHEEFEAWYQPKYSTKTCSIIGCEALVRWRKEDGTMISPGAFIPLFEQNGMIVKLDEYMFRIVCRQLKKWKDEGKKRYPVSINISRASLYYMDVHKRYYDIMQEYQVDPQYIQLEVTESILEEKAGIHEILNKFREMGIKILMDDFGTGYSSLATLSLQCFDTLKLDKTLIDHIGNKDGETMLYHIIHMGQQMGLHVTAEGVETQIQLEFLQNMKCDDVQGFYFSKPVPQKQYEQMIQEET